MSKRRRLTIAVIVVMFIVGAVLFIRLGAGSEATAPVVSELTAESLIAAGLSAYTAGDLKSARVSFDAARDVDPTSAIATFNLGAVAGAEGRLDEALGFYVEAVSLDPALDIAWYNRGVTEAQLGRPGDAMVSYSKALEANAANNAAKWNLGILLYEQGRRKQARPLLRDVIAADPSYESRRPADLILD